MSQSQRIPGIFLAYATQLAHIVVALAYTPVMVRMLGQNEYGLYEMVRSIIAALGMLSLGFTGAYLRFFTRFAMARNKKGMATLNGMFMAVFLAIAAITLLLGGVLVGYTPTLLNATTSEQEIHTAKILMAILSANMAISFPLSVFNCNLVANEQFIFHRGLALFSAVCNPLLSLPLLFMGYGSIGLAGVSLFLNTVLLGLSWYYCIKYNAMSFSLSKFDWMLLKEVCIFSFWMFLNFITDQINWNAGRFILGKMVGTSAVAVFAIGALFNQLYLTLSVSISSVYVPMVNRIVEENNDNQTLTDIFIKIGRSQLFLLVFFIGGFALLGKFFIHLWVGDAYSQAYLVALLLIVPVTIPLIQNLGIDIMKAKNMHQFRSIVYVVGSMLNIIISIVLARQYHEVGVACGTAIALIVCNGFVINWYYQKHVGLDIVRFWKNILPLLATLLVPPLLCLIGCIYIPVTSLTTFFFWGILYTAFYASLLYFICLNVDEKAYVTVAVKRFLPKGKR